MTQYRVQCDQPKGDWDRSDVSRHRLQPLEIKQKKATTSNVANHKPKSAWRNLIIFSLFHLALVPGIYMAIFRAKWQTNLFAAVLYVVAKIGMCAGVHRLWSHKSYKVTWQLNALLLVFFTIAFEGDAWHWVRDHRAHHKYQETDADPYNARRGLWFSHIGWLLQSKHPDVIERGRGIDMSDLDSDPLVMFQKRYYLPLVFLLSFYLPTATAVSLWGESWLVALLVAVCVRSVACFHGTWVVNSIAHAYGNRPYDQNLMATQSTPVIYLTLGEGWHNYHHTFPWDYRTSEMGLQTFNVTKGFIDFFAKIGWAYDLKTVPQEMIHKRALRTGDGSHPVNEEKELWGWGDKDMSTEQRLETTIINRKRV